MIFVMLLSKQSMTVGAFGQVESGGLGWRVAKGKLLRALVKHDNCGAMPSVQGRDKPPGPTMSSRSAESHIQYDLP